MHTSERVVLGHLCVSELLESAAAKVWVVDKL